MNNSDTPTGENGRKELKVTKSNEDLLQKYFEKLEKEGYGKIHLNCITFDVPPEKIQGPVKDEETQGFEEVINNPEPGRKTFDPLQINAGVRVREGKADQKKVKAKVEQIKKRNLEKKEAEKKNPAGGTEKQSENRDR